MNSANFLNMDLLQFVKERILYVPLVLVALTAHEVAHGFMAWKLGDATAKYDGRLSPNPLRHVDPIGFLCMVLLRFGWAKPVMINPRNLENPKVDMALIAAAGPVANFLLALVSIFIYFPLALTGPPAHGPVREVGLLLLSQSCVLNLSLGMFNLLPLPPLDGSKVFSALIPDRVFYKLPDLSRWGMPILMLLIVTQVIDRVLGPLVSGLMRFYVFLASNVYSFLM